MKVSEQVQMRIRKQNTLDRTTEMLQLLCNYLYSYDSEFLFTYTCMYLK